MAQAQKSKSSTPSNQSPNPLREISDATETIALSSGIGISGAMPAGYETGLDLSQIAEQSIARVLGGPVAPEPMQILKRLSAVFPETTSNGVTTFTYQPIGAQPSIGATGAYVSGAQSTIYRQAQTLAKSINTLLDTMEPVITDPDIADIQALTATFRSTVADIVEEFGREGGAVIQRVHVLTSTLIDIQNDLIAKLGGRADEDALDLEILKRDMIEENKEMLVNLVDQLTSARNGLVAPYDKNVLNGVSATYAQLIWVVSAVPTTVQQAYLEFDAIRFGSNDRRITSVKDAGNRDISIEQALKWCESSAGTWAQSLSSDARTEDLKIINDEAVVIEPILDKVREYVRNKIPGSRRVTAALKELDRQLEQIHDFATVIIKRTAE
jgi:uncharacterized protein YutE (UPF0331/DUF86 family)